MNTKLQISILLIVTINIIGCGGAAQQPTPTSTPLPTSTPDIAATNTASVAETAEARPTFLANMRTSTAEAKNILATETAQPYYEEILRLQSDGFISTTDGEFYTLLDQNTFGRRTFIYDWTVGTTKNPKNFILTADIDWEISDDSEVDLSLSGCGFVYHSDLSDNFNMAILSFDGFVTIHQRKNGKWGQQSRRIVENINIPADQIKFTLIVEKDFTTVLINGEQIIKYYDPNPLSGLIKYVTVSDVDNEFYTSCNFTNVNVWELSGVIDQSELVSEMAENFTEEVENYYANGYLSSTEGKALAITDYVMERALINWYSWRSAGINLDNFIIRTDLRWNTASETSNWWNTGCGFIFRLQDNNNYYGMFLNLDGFVEIWREVNDRAARLAYKNYGNLDIPEGNAKLTMIVDGESIIVFVNGKLVASVHDTRYDEGAFNFAVSSGTNKDFGTRCEFDNVFIWEIR